MKVAFFFRKPTANFFSIEVLFNTIISNLKGVSASSVYLPYKSAAQPFQLLRNCLYAFRRQDQINHITGDVNYLALALPKTNTILTLHDVESLQSRNKYKNALLQFLWLKAPVKRVKYVTVVSEHSKRQILATCSVPADKVVVIPNCVSFTSADYKPKDSIDKKCPVLLQVGTKQNKNLENLVRALKDIPCKLIIIGSLSDAQQALLKESRITYRNYSSLSYDKVVELYYEADIVTFVSVYEGFGLPILEANALGRPVITSNCTAMPEVAGEGALLVDPSDPGEIRLGIIKLVQEDKFRNDLVAAGYKNSQRFRADVVAAQYEALYQRVRAENA
ncbi:glycosyltransferase family 4 protein [Pontibacter sp. MBLB2868]|uniref:glycosyltransferase family 4 protein n=1 Tax=Pontibacter sp. MBLB2868 TaxID=3451555 RepID=UPI003F74CBD4